MDLRKLEKWSRDELVAEAARRGIPSAEVLTRRELLEAIGDVAEASGEAVTRSTLSRARRLVERLAFGERRSSAPPPAEHRSSAPPPAGHRSSAPPPAEHRSSAPPPAEHRSSVPQPAEHRSSVPPPAEHRSSVPQPAEHRSSVPQPGATPSSPVVAAAPPVPREALPPAPRAGVVPPVAPAPAFAVPPVAKVLPVAPVPPSPRAIAAPAVPRPAAPLGAEPLRRLDALEPRPSSIPVPVVELRMLPETILAPPDDAPLPDDATASVPPAPDPIRTRTMARLLAAQGHVERARAIFDELLGGAPPGGALHREREALGAMHVAPSLRDPSPVAAPRHTSVDQVTALVVDPTTLFVCWEVTVEGTRRARSLAGDAAPLALRVMVVAAGAKGVETVELARSPLPEAGETFVTDLPPGAVCTAAVGLAGARFVAIAHAASAETPPSTPASSVSLVVRPRAHPAEPDAADVPSRSAPTETLALSGDARTARLAEAARAEALEVAESAESGGGTATLPSSPGGAPSGPGGAPSSPRASSRTARR